jgi:hypothetical protein
VALLPILLLAGCIGGPDDSNGAQEEGVTLIIDFEGFEPETHPWKRAVWSPDGEGNWSLSLEDPPKNGTVYYVLNVTAATVLDALVEAGRVTGVEVMDHRESMGAFVDSIDGVENGRDGHYWSYYLNDEYGVEASNKAAISDGDEVRWVYMGNPFG